MVKNGGEAKPLKKTSPVIYAQECSTYVA
uniref:Uncharacterized protein n=1 Tax=Arundo donax TaxID=35708 RepID=A0A0A9FGS7_ARUDO